MRRLLSAVPAAATPAGGPSSAGGHGSTGEPGLTDGPGLAGGRDPVEFDLDRRWRLHPQVSVRPEAFGALLYHFGTRRLSFLKEPALLALVQALPEHPSARVAAEAVGLNAGQLRRYQQALAALAVSDTIVEAG